jgi:hypothetical protein
MRIAGRKRAIAESVVVAFLVTLLACPAGPASAQTSPSTTTEPGTSTSGAAGTSTSGAAGTSTSGAAGTSTTPTQTSSPSGANQLETLQALQQAMPSVLAYSLNPITTTPDPDAALTTEQDDIKVDVPKTSAAGVTLNGPSMAPMKVGLPIRGSGQPAVLANDGVAVYQHADTETSVAVQPVGVGAVRVMQVIDGPHAPTSFRFRLKIPPGGSIRRTSTSSEDRFAILDANGDGVASISTPWSHDGAGNSVPTSYHLDGRTLVQDVDHSGFTYPVVADPLISLGCAWVQCSVYLSRSATRTLGDTLQAVSGAAADAIAAAAGAACLGLTGGTATVVCIYAGKILGQFLINKLIDATNRGGCLRIGFRPPFFLSAGSVSATNDRHCDDGVAYGPRRRLQAGERLVTALNVRSQNATYLVVGGAKLWISSRDEFAALGLDWSQDEHMSSEEIKQFSDVPVDSTLIKERSDSKTFVISGRHRWWISDRDHFVRNHFDWNNVHIAPDGSLVSTPYAGPLP